MFFDELNNDEWVQLGSLVSEEPAVRLNRRGRPRAEPRIVANAVLWILTTGEPWSKLPGRYPSGPTCRRRFEEWQANGTLTRMVELLSQNGRTFAYIPEPTPPAASRPAPSVEAPKPRDEPARGVFWKSPDSWQSAGLESRARPLDAMSDITRQLAGAMPSDAQLEAHLESNPEFESNLEWESQPALESQSPYLAADPTAEVCEIADSTAVAANEPPRAVWPQRGTAWPAADGRRTPLWMSLASPAGTRVTDGRGYVIYAAAEQVTDGHFRAWAELMKDGERVERSGLIGPRFDNAEAARQYALDWAREWIGRAGVAEVPAGVGVSQPPAPVARAMPDTAAVKASVKAPGVPANSAYAQHANGHRMPALRRCPTDGQTGQAEWLPVAKGFASALN